MSNLQRTLFSKACGFCTKAARSDKTPRKIGRNAANEHFLSHAHLAKMKTYIPAKYFAIKPNNYSEHMYLADETVAKDVAGRHILPVLKKSKNQLVCETNAGLGLIASELLDGGLPAIRLYESCPEFRLPLKDFDVAYPGRVELFSKDIFLLHRMSYFDKQDRGNRVEQLLAGIPKKEWSEDPAMSIIGTLSNHFFLHYLLKMFVMQQEIMRFGRIQFFLFLKPNEYITLAAGPHLNLHTYQRKSVLFNLFFDHELLGKYPRQSFLPWERAKAIGSRTHYAKRIDPDCMYFVKVNFKKTLPLDTEYLLPLFYFVRQFFGRGSNPVVASLEKWIPGCGANLILPSKKRKNNFTDMNIYTTFGELTPNEILSVFLELIAHPHYKSSPFVSMIEAELLKSETVETDIADLDEPVKNTEVFKMTTV